MPASCEYSGHLWAYTCECVHHARGVCVCASTRDKQASLWARLLSPTPQLGEQTSKNHNTK